MSVFKLMSNTISQTIKQARANLVQFVNTNPDIGSEDRASKILEYFESKNSLLINHAEQLQQVLDMLSDEASKTQYCNYLSFKLLVKINKDLAFQNDPNFLKENFAHIFNNFENYLHNNGLTMPYIDARKSMEDLIYSSVVCTFGVQQYLYPKQIEVGFQDVFIDCGGFVGETAIWAHQKGAQVYSFEPIPDTYQYLKHNFKQNGLDSNNAFNLGVSNTNQQVVFKLPLVNASAAFIDKNDGNNVYQKFLESQTELVEHKVQCVRLDDWLKAKNIKATFIKMDIEGAELDALQGAEQTIIQNRPKLAICLYHRDEDLYTIPLYLKSLVPEYKFFCKENYPSSEFVLYATV